MRFPFTILLLVLGALVFMWIVTRHAEPVDRDEPETVIAGEIK